MQTGGREKVPLVVPEELVTHQRGNYEEKGGGVVRKVRGYRPDKTGLEQ